MLAKPEMGRVPAEQTLPAYFSLGWDWYEDTRMTGASGNSLLGVVN